jgi:hypothetical protein
MAQADHLPSPIHDLFPDASATKPTSCGQPAAHENKEGETDTAAVRTSAPTAEARPGHRRHFIGGSDARIIMGDDQASLLRLWREKRGEIEPEDLSGNLIVQLGVVTESALVRGQYGLGDYGRPAANPPSGAAVDGRYPRWPDRG